MRVSAVPLALALALSAVPALAQPVAPVAPVPAVEPAPTVVYARASAIDFTQANITGDRDGPSGAVIWAPPHAKFRNLIALRANFRPELARSASRLPSAVP